MTFGIHIESVGSYEESLEHLCPGDASCDTCSEDMEAIFVGSKIHYYDRSATPSTSVGAKDCHPGATEVYGEAVGL